MSPLSILPRSASTLAPQTDALYFALAAVSLAIVALVLFLTVFFALRYRRGSPAPRGPMPTFVQHQFEIGWTVATLFGLLFFFWWAGSNQTSQLLPPRSAMEIHVVAKQWMWKLQHPNGAREINTLHVPVNEPVRLVMTSQDVIHSFAVPDFRIKQDILPGRYVGSWFEATKTGAFRLYCTQFCGTAHSAMTGSIVVMSQPDFAAWLAAQPATGDLVAEGRALFISLGCAGCHTAGGPVHAPDLAGLFGRRVPLANGDFALVDDAYIRYRILFPKDNPPAGYAPIMPSFKGELDDGNSRADRLHPLARRANRSSAMTDAVASFASGEPHPGEGTTGNYLDSRGRGFSEWLLTTDHKRIALLSAALITGFFFIGGAAATLIRLELFSPTARFLTDDGYNLVFTLHGVIMVWFFLVPLIPTTLGNFLLPLMIGAPDVAFPKLNLASWYFTLIGGLFVLAAMLMGGVDTGWTFYPPYSTSFSHSNVAVAVLGVIIAGFGTIATGVNFVATTHMLRAPGMTWFRLPLMVWALYATSLVMILVTEVITRFARRRVFGYAAMVYAIVAIAIIGFAVWGHHMFVSGQSAFANLVFSFLSFIVAVPSAIKVFNWTATLYRGQITFEAPMLYALGFVGLFTVGGLTGVFLASIPIDVQVTGTYFGIAHFHYVMVGGAVSAYFAGLHFWWPKITGRLYAEAWARFAAYLMFFGFNFTFFPQFILGYLGMPRRYHTYPPEFQTWNVMSSTGAVVLAAAYLAPLFYLAWSLIYGKVAPANPWNATGLEWRTTSPPPTRNFARTPIVTEEPYDYHDPQNSPEPETRSIDTMRPQARGVSRRTRRRPRRERRGFRIRGARWSARPSARTTD